MTKKSFNYQLIFIILIVIIIGSWALKILQNELPYVDQWTRAFVEIVGNTKVYLIARFVTEFGSRSFLIPFTIITAIYLCWLYRNWLPALFFVSGTLGTHILNIWIKYIVGRERPSILVEANAQGYSFPSGHAMISIVCYGFLTYLLIKKYPNKKGILATSFTILIFLIGISRYIINVHYLTDVIAGFTIGYLLLQSLIVLFNFVYLRGVTKKGARTEQNKQP